MNSIQNKIETQIKKAGRGKFVFPSQFASFASQDAAIKALQRLMASGNLIRISQGVYYYPNPTFHLEEIFKNLTPSTDPSEAYRQFVAVVTD